MAVWHKAKGLDPPPVDHSGNAILPAAQAQSAAGQRAQTADLPEPEAEYVFARDGDGYRIRGFGQSGHLSATRGLDQIYTLIQTPGQPVRMIRLVEASHDRRISGRQSQSAADRRRRSSEADS